MQPTKKDKSITRDKLSPQTAKLSI